MGILSKILIASVVSTMLSQGVNTSTSVPSCTKGSTGSEGAPKTCSLPPVKELIRPVYNGTIFNSFELDVEVAVKYVGRELPLKFVVPAGWAKILETQNAPMMPGLGEVQEVEQAIGQPIENIVVRVPEDLSDESSPGLGKLKSYVRAPKANGSHSHGRGGHGHRGCRKGHRHHHDHDHDRHRRHRRSEVPEIQPVEMLAPFKALPAGAAWSFYNAYFDPRVLTGNYIWTIRGEGSVITIVPGYVPEEEEEDGKLERLRQSLEEFSQGRRRGGCVIFLMLVSAAVISMLGGIVCCCRRRHLRKQHERLLIQQMREQQHQIATGVYVAPSEKEQPIPISQGGQVYLALHGNAINIQRQPQDHSGHHHGHHHEASH